MRLAPRRNWIVPRNTCLERCTRYQNSGPIQGLSEGAQWRDRIDVRRWKRMRPLRLPGGLRPEARGAPPAALRAEPPPFAAATSGNGNRGSAKSADSD